MRCTAGLLACLLAWPGCASRRRPPAPPVLGAEAVRARLVERASRPLEGEVAVSGRHRGRRLRARALVVLDPPARLYVETFEGSAAVLASDGERLRLILGERRLWVEAEASRENFRRLLGVPLAAAEIGALLGRAGAPAEDLRRARFDGPAVWLEGGRLVLDGAGEVVGGELNGVRFRYRERRHLSIEVAAEDLMLELRLAGAAEPPPPRAPDFFRPAAPAGFAAVALERLETPVLLSGGRDADPG